MGSFLGRLIGAARLDVATYEEVEADRTATGQAMAVVVLTSLATGVGAMGSDAALRDFVAGALGALVGWFIWAFLTYLVGTKLLPEPETRSDVGELLRTTGFSASPGLLRALGFVPALAVPVLVVTSLWMLVTFVVAVRQALDYRSTVRAVAVCVLGWLVYLVFSLATGLLLAILMS
jgi:Yip1 domain